MTRLEEELVQLQRTHPTARLVGMPEGTHLVEVGPLSVPAGWSHTTVSPAFVAPTGYPAAQPDCFYVIETLTLSDGRAPQNSGRQALAGRDWTWFSWHLRTWRPGLDTLVTFVRFIEARLCDVR